MTDNMRIWDAVSKTNPANTKKVNQRGGFTAINANSQIMEATRQFGPIGIGWGYNNGDPIFQDTLVIVPVTVWHGDRSNVFGPVFGCEEWKVKDRVDSDAPKKAGTDGLTKCLSQLGFNADVFLGLYDDQKYVAEVEREFAAKEVAASPPPANTPAPNAKITDATRDWILDQLTTRKLESIALCRSLNIATLKDLTYGQMDAVKEWLRNPQQKAA